MREVGDTMQHLEGLYRSMIENEAARVAAEHGVKPDALLIRSDPGLLLAGTSNAGTVQLSMGDIGVDARVRPSAAGLIRCRWPPPP